MERGRSKRAYLWSQHTLSTSIYVICSWFSFIIPGVADTGCLQIGHIIAFSRYRALCSSYGVVDHLRKHHATPMTATSATVRPTSPCLTLFTSSPPPGAASADAEVDAVEVGAEARGAGPIFGCMVWRYTTIRGLSETESQRWCRRPRACHWGRRCRYQCYWSSVPCPARVCREERGGSGGSGLSSCTHTQ